MLGQYAEFNPALLCPALPSPFPSHLLLSLLLLSSLLPLLFFDAGSCYVAVLLPQSACPQCWLCRLPSPLFDVTTEPPFFSLVSTAQLEERAQQIRSKSYLIQVEREKMQMELSHKRARVELERAANTSARNYEVGPASPRGRGLRALVRLCQTGTQLAGPPDASRLDKGDLMWG